MRVNQGGEGDGVTDEAGDVEGRAPPRPGRAGRGFACPKHHSPPRPPPRRASALCAEPSAGGRAVEWIYHCAFSPVCKHRCLCQFIIVRLHEIIDQTKYSHKVGFTIVESAKLAWNNRISLRGYLARIYLGYRHFLILCFWNWIETNLYPPTTHSLLLYNGENLSLRSILLFAHGDICIGRFELYRQITRVRGKWIKKKCLICWLCHRYLCVCRLNQTCLVARLSATEIWATAIFFFNNWF